MIRKIEYTCDTIVDRITSTDGYEIEPVEKISTFEKFLSAEFEVVIKAKEITPAERKMTRKNTRARANSVSRTESMDERTVATPVNAEDPKQFFELQPLKT